MKKVIRLTESDLQRIVRRVIKEQSSIVPNPKSFAAQAAAKDAMEKMKTNMDYLKGREKYGSRNIGNTKQHALKFFQDIKTWGDSFRYSFLDQPIKIMMKGSQCPSTMGKDSLAYFSSNNTPYDIWIKQNDMDGCRFFLQSTPTYNNNISDYEGWITLDFDGNVKTGCGGPVVMSNEAKKLLMNSCGNPKEQGYVSNKSSYGQDIS